MVIGTYILALATVAALLSTFGYFMIARGNTIYLAASRWSYYLMSSLVLIAIAYMVTLFLGNHFEYSYISHYSSLDLATNFKVTSLWAGQEGSFLLWVTFGVLLGIWVRSKAKEQLGWVMFFYLVGQLFLFALLNISSPFKMNQMVPADGQGLNPLLQNYWMQIHPPIVFLGYASTFVPFAFAMAALATNKYSNWVKLTLPWAIFSVCALGTGIFLGGYWAYETLGWGGYWGWDPVENASLVPWLGSIALVHGMLLEKHRGSFKKTNLFLAITTFLMVIFGTFLTRSGVLADFSVHSFVDLGLSAYLVIFLISFTVLSYGLLVYRMKAIDSANPGKSPWSREFVVFLAMLFVILSAFLILLGMSSPLLTRLVGEPSAVDISYYTMTNLPIAIIIGIVLGLGGILSWGVSEWRVLRRRLILPVVVALGFVLIGVILGVRNVVHALFIFTSGFAFMANLIEVISRARNGLKFILADIIHTGAAMMLIGIIVSSAYSSEKKVTLERDKPNNVLGFNMQFLGAESVDKDRDMAHVRIQHGASVFQASPVFLWSKQGLVRNPYIKKFLLYDLYISPEELKSAGDEASGSTAVLSQGQTGFLSGLEITFNRFDVGNHMEAGPLTIGADLTVKTAEGKTETVKPLFVVAGGEQPDLVAAKIGGTSKSIYLLKINADKGLIMIGVTDKDNPDEFKSSEKLIVNVSKKPLINLVWFGLIMIIFGAGASTYRRLKEVK